MRFSATVVTFACLLLSASALTIPPADLLGRTDLEDSSIFARGPAICTGNNHHKSPATCLKKTDATGYKMNGQCYSMAELKKIQKVNGWLGAAGKCYYPKSKDPKAEAEDKSEDEKAEKALVPVKKA